MIPGLKKINMRAKYRALFSSELGKEVLEHIAKNGFISRSTFVKGDANETLLNEGSRRLALSILKFAGEEKTVELIERT